MLNFCCIIQSTDKALIFWSSYIFTNLLCNVVMTTKKCLVSFIRSFWLLILRFHVHTYVQFMHQRSFIATNVPYKIRNLKYDPLICFIFCIIAHPQKYKLFQELVEENFFNTCIFRNFLTSNSCGIELFFLTHHRAAGKQSKSYLIFSIS